MSLFWGFVIVVVVDAIAITAMLLVRRRAPEGQLLHGRRPRLRRLRRARDGVRDLRRLRHLPRVHDLRPVAGRRRGRGADRRAAVRDCAVPRPRDARSPGGRARLLRPLGRATRSGRGWRPATSGDAINPWGVALFRTIRAADTTTLPEQAAFAKWLDQTSDREEARRDRVHGAAGITPTTALDRPAADRVVIFVYMLFFADSARDEALAGDAHRLGDDGRRGDAARDLRARQPVPPGLGSIRPVAMERTLVILGEAHAALGDDAAVPCDAEGGATCVVTDATA